MNLSIKVKAFIQALGILIACSVTGVVMSIALSRIPMEAYPYIGISALVVLAMNLLYSMSLSRLEHQESLKKLNDLNKKD